LESLGHNTYNEKRKPFLPSFLLSLSYGNVLTNKGKSP
jgi:hypothetical protein